MDDVLRERIDKALNNVEQWHQVPEGTAYQFSADDIDGFDGQQAIVFMDYGIRLELSASEAPEALDPREFYNGCRKDEMLPKGVTRATEGARLRPLGTPSAASLLDGVGLLDDVCYIISYLQQFMRETSDLSDEQTALRSLVVAVHESEMDIEARF